MRYLLVGGPKDGTEWDVPNHAPWNIGQSINIPADPPMLDLKKLGGPRSSPPEPHAKQHDVYVVKTMEGDLAIAHHHPG